MNATELTLAITALANAISEGMDIAELALTASVFVQIGDTLATIAAHKALRE